MLNRAGRIRHSGPTVDELNGWSTTRAISHLALYGAFLDKHAGYHLFVLLGLYLH
jgi:hypothetical protein